MLGRVAAVLMLAMISIGPAYADPIAGLDLATAQFLGIEQRSFPFHSPYSGENSLPADGESHFSHSYLVSLGKRFGNKLSAYVDARLLRGEGIGHENGLGGYANADFTEGARRSGSYVFRAYLYGIASGRGQPEPVQRDIDHIPGDQPGERIEWKLGRFMPTDDFDQLRYAQNGAKQFLNLGLVNNPAWDNAQSARGETEGAYAGLIREHWELRLGAYRMPLTANGPVLDSNLARSRSDNAEITLKPKGDDGPVLRLLAFHNRGRMGDYREALALRPAGSAPDIRADERAGRRKHGATLNAELPLADGGDTGLFVCAGWNDGATEDFSFTESDRDACAGVQVRGARWGRGDDRFGAAVLVNGLAPAHRDYLAAGGSGFQLGDGALNYGTERIVETYYLFTLSRHAELSPDLQIIGNPGFNRDRGPAKIAGVRLRLSF